MSLSTTSIRFTTRGRGARRIVGVAALGLTAAVFALPAAPANAVGAGTYIFAPDYTTNTLLILDAGTGATAASVPVAGTPLAVAVSPNGLRAYVPGGADGTVSVVDTSQDAVVATVQLPADAQPTDATVSPDGTKVYVTDAGNSQVDVIDTATNTLVDTVDVANYPYAVLATATHVYTANNGGTVSVMNVATDVVSDTIPVALDDPNSLVLVPGSNLLWVGGEDNGIDAIDTSSNTVVKTVDNVSAGGGPGGNLKLAASPDGSKLYASTDDGLTELDGSTGATLASADLSQLGLDGRTVSQVAVGPDGRIYVYGWNNTDGAMVTVDPSTLNPVSTLALSNGVQGLKVGTIAPTPPPAKTADVQAKVTGPASGKTGTAYTYTVTATDVGPGVAAQVGSTVLLPSGTTLVSASGSYTKIGQLVVWKATPDLAVNGSVSNTVTVKFSTKGTKLVSAAAASLKTRDPRLLNNLALVSTSIK